MIGAFERRISKKLVFGPHRAQQTHCVNGRQQKDQSHAAKPGHQHEAQAAERKNRPRPKPRAPSSQKDKIFILALVYRRKAATDIQSRF